VVPHAPVKHYRCVDFDGLHVHYLPGIKRFDLMGQLSKSTSKAIQHKLSELTFDLVHFQGCTAWSRELEGRHVLTIHGIAERDVLFRGRFRWLKSRIVRYIEGRGRRRFANIIVINPYVRKEVAGDLRGRTWEIENPVADDFFDVEHRPVSGRILFAGFVSARKNVKGLIKAFSIVAKNNPEAELRIAGAVTESRYGQECKQMVAKCRLEQKIHFLGPLSVKALQAEMSSAWCLALCSYQETAPVIIGEAMSVGLPVVASNICGIPYLVSDGETGKLVDPNDTLDIANGLLSVLESEDYEGMCHQAKAAAEQRFRASVVARKTYDVYEIVCARRHNCR